MKTINLENAKKLQELGVTSESYFWSYRCPDKDYSTQTPREDQWVTVRSLDCGWTEKIQAYTADEIGDMLPESGWTFSRWSFNRETAFTAHFSSMYTDCGGMSFRADTMADAMVAMLIWLIENEHIDVSEINKGQTK